MIFRILMACGAPSVPPVTETPAEVEAPEPPDAAAEVERSPTIVIDSPAPGTLVVPGPLMVQGDALVFEGRFTVKLLAGDELIDQKAIVTSADGARWSAEFTVPEGHSGGPWKLQAYSQSAKDGSIVNLVEVPLDGP